MVPELNPKQSDIAAHLHHITRRWHELDRPAKLEIVCLSSEDRAVVKDVARFSFDKMGLDFAAEHIAAMNKHKINVYAVINPVDASKPLQAGKRASRDDIIGSFYHWADADDAQAAENIKSFVGPKCTLHVLTGTQPCLRPHVYWELEEPTYNLQAWEATQKAIAATLRTDPSVTDAPRIMRLAGTINWPKPQKQGKGYIAELTSLHVYDPQDRPPVSSERMARAFSAGAAAAAPAGSGFSIDTGALPTLDRERVSIQAMSGQEWHNAVIRLVASYVSRGLSDNEIHALTDPLTLPGYTVDQTRQEVAVAIGGARAKGWAPAEIPEAIKFDAEAADTAAWPTPYDFFDEAAISPRQWIYANHYLRSFVSVMASAGGIGKTSLQIVEALAIVTGRPLLGETVVEPCNVWVINLEDPAEEMQRRILAAMKFYNIRPSEVRGKLFVDAGREFQIKFAVQTREGIAPNDALVEHLIKRIPERNIGCVFIDPFVGAHEINENDNMAMNAVVAKIRDVADAANCAIGLVHHVRKGNGQDADIDSVRGAGSLIGAARAARIINRVSEDEAIRLGVPRHEARGIFRVDDGKANLSPPATAAVYRKMEGVQIANGEWIGVAVPFQLPDGWSGMSTDIINEMLRQIDAGLQNTASEEYYSIRPQDKDRWVGKVITEYPFARAEDFKSVEQAKTIIKEWLKTGLLEEMEYHSAAQRKDRKGVVSKGRVGDQS